MSKLQRNHTGLGVESLERRLMLDGNVTVLVARGDLFIRGDELDNAIRITPAEEVGSYWIQGLDTEHENADGHDPAVVSRPTTINGEAEPLKVEGVRDDFKIFLGRGNDSVALVGKRPIHVDPGDSTTGHDGVGHDGAGHDVDPAMLVVPDDLVISTSAGNDTVELTSVRAGSDIRIGTSRGDDTVTLSNVAVRDHLLVKTSSGDDVVTLADVRTRGRATVNTGSGDDAVTIEHTTVGSDLVVRTGAGNDTVKLVATEVKDDVFVNTAAVRIRRLSRMDERPKDDDAVMLDRLKVADLFSLYTGAGDDEVSTPDVVVHDGTDGFPDRYYSVAAAHAAIFTGAGDDTVNLNYAKIGRGLFVGLGAGDDALKAVDNVVAGMAYISGGPGKDTHNENIREVNKFGHLRLVGFGSDERWVPIISEDVINALFDSITRRTRRRG